MTLRVDDNQALDLVIRGGRVFDPGAGIDEVLDVGVRYGRIVALERDLSARVAERRTEMPLDLGTPVIDATGRTVAPGFNKGPSMAMLPPPPSVSYRPARVQPSCVTITSKTL